jgi:hypothetical protein
MKPHPHAQLSLFAKLRVIYQSVKGPRAISAEEIARKLEKLAS